MPIKRRISDEEQACFYSSEILDDLARLLQEGTPHHEETEVVWAVLQPLELALGRNGRPALPEFRKAFEDALGDDAAQWMEVAFGALDHYRLVLQQEQRPSLGFNEPTARDQMLKGVEKLRDLAKNRDFFLPSVAMLHPRSNTHLCTGR